MKICVIISVYKDVEALSLIVDSLLHQTIEVDEIVISEDCNSIEMKEYFSTLNNQKVKHLFQEDNGWQKNKALNRAINCSASEYLIFIDGDCIPYPTFVESHKLLSESNTVLCGRRSEPGNLFSSLLRTQNLTIEELVSSYLKNYFKFKKDDIRHYEDGIYFHPHSLFFRIISKLRKNKTNHIVGCNFSCWKSDLEMINGFDEDFTMPTTGEDTDIERRLLHFGVKMKSCRYSANIVHLYHKKIFNKEITNKSEAL
ncbi:MAG: glycosyltransferase, partial [Arcobacteraceae bacterium]